MSRTSDGWVIESGNDGKLFSMSGLEKLWKYLSEIYTGINNVNSLLKLHITWMITVLMLLVWHYPLCTFYKIFYIHFYMLTWVSGILFKFLTICCIVNILKSTLTTSVQVSFNLSHSLGHFLYSPIFLHTHHMSIPTVFILACYNRFHFNLVYFSPFVSHSCTLILCIQQNMNLHLSNLHRPQSFT